MWCYQCDASYNIAVYVFADRLCKCQDKNQADTHSTSEKVHICDACICWQSTISCLDLIASSGEKYDLFCQNICDIKVFQFYPFLLRFPSDMPKTELCSTASLGDPENMGEGWELRRDCWQSGVRGRWGFRGFGEVSLQLLNIKMHQLKEYHLTSQPWQEETGPWSMRPKQT